MLPPFDAAITPVAAAEYNIDYSAQLELAEPGTYSFWLITDAAQAGGFTLSSDGVLSGRPTQVGTLDLQIGIRNSNNQNASVTLPVTVGRKPWLAFRVQTGITGGNSYQLYLKHVYRATSPVSVLSSAPSTTTFDRFGFSPDGSRLAFLADAVTDGQRNLYVTNTSGETVADGELAVGNADVYSFAWSPDSSTIAYVVYDAGVYALWAIDGVAGGSPYELSSDIGGYPEYLTWVSGTFITCVVNSEVYAWRRDGAGGFSSLGPLAIGDSGSVGPTTADNLAQRLFVSRTYSAGGMPSTWDEIVDFTDPDLSYISTGGLRDYTDDFQLGFRCSSPPEVVLLDGTFAQVAEFSGAGCGGIFAQRTRDVFYADASRVRRQHFVGQALDGEPELVPGTYVPDTNKPMALSAGERWLLFSGATEVYATNLEAASPGEAQLVSGTFAASASGVSRVIPAPTSRTFVYSGDQDFQDLRGIYYVDLEQSPIPEARDVVADVDTGRVNDSMVAFSHDSAVLAFSFQYGDDYCPELHLVNLLEDGARSTDPLASWSPSTSGGSCADVANVLAVASGMSTAFQFQP